MRTEVGISLLVFSLILLSGFFLLGGGTDGPRETDATGDSNGSVYVPNPADNIPENDTSFRSSTPRTYSELNAPPNSTWFRDRAEEAGFVYESGYSEYIVGRLGIYVSDFNRDGYPDILVNSADDTVLFVNQESQFHRSGVLPEIENTIKAAFFFDYDNDGWDDLYLMSNEGSVFLENERGEFVERDVGLNVDYDAVIGAAAADYTGNGCLDLFVIQHGNWSKSRPKGMNNLNVTIEEDNGNRNRLFAGNCSSFEETTGEAGIEGSSWSLATSFVDLTNDGYPDIHVANDFNNDVVYINEGDGTFERNVLPNSTNRNGMSSEVADVNGDGYLDIFVTNIHSDAYSESSVRVYRVGGRKKGNNLLINQGNGSFVDRAEEYGVRKGGWGWSALLEDFDNDGDNELFHTTSSNIGASTSNLWDRTRDEFEAKESRFKIDSELEELKQQRKDIREEVRTIRRTAESRGDLSGDKKDAVRRLQERLSSVKEKMDDREARLEDLNTSGTRSSGLLPSRSVSAAALDYDLDGAMDIAETVLNKRYHLYENRVGDGNYLQVDVEGDTNGTDIGTRVYVTFDGGTLMEVKTSASDYISQSTRTLHFGLADAQIADRLRVEYPDGRSCSFEDVGLNRRITVTPDCELR